MLRAPMRKIVLQHNLPIAGMARFIRSLRRRERVTSAKERTIEPQRWEMAMITGMHAVVYTRDAEADRAFFRDVLGFSSVDAGGGWLIFAAPPSELACHPAE